MSEDDRFQDEYLSPTALGLPVDEETNEPQLPPQVTRVAAGDGEDGAIVGEGGWVHAPEPVAAEGAEHPGASEPEASEPGRSQRDELRRVDMPDERTEDEEKRPRRRRGWFSRTSK